MPFFWNVLAQNGQLYGNRHLNSKEEFKGKVVAFTSWNVFPYILNEERSGLMVNSGYENMDEQVVSSGQALINKVQSETIDNKAPTRYDQLTFLTAKEYIQQHQPKLFSSDWVKQMTMHTMVVTTFTCTMHIK